jgi:hypothetical protein
MQPSDQVQARRGTIAFAYVRNQIDIPKEINNGIGRHSCRKCCRPYKDDMQVRRKHRKVEKRRR